MVQSNFESKVKIQEIIDNQIPEFILEENPKFSEFLKQYYISQEYQGGSVDIVENLVEYLKLDNLTPDIISGNSKLTQVLSESDDIIFTNNTKGFPNSYGLLQIDDEIITYKEKLNDRFIGCIRGFSGIETYENQLTFNSSQSSSHLNDAPIVNLSVLFLQKFYEKIKFTFLPGLEKVNLYDELNVNNFIKNSKSFYQAKGTKESFRILFGALYGIEPNIVDLETFLFKTSAADYRRRKELIFENLTADKNPLLLIGKQITKNTDSSVFGSVSEVEIFSRNNKEYYKFYIFIGYDDANSESSGDFLATSSSKVVENILSTNNEKTLTVDSTIGFQSSGSIFYDSTEIFYTDKSINQFFGCYTKNINYSVIATFIVTIAAKTSNHQYSGTGSGLGYYLNGIESPLLTLILGKTYRFNQEDASNATHQLRFYATADKATPYTANITTVGTAGSPGAYTEIVVTDQTPVTLHYQCVNHAYMGNAIQIDYNINLNIPKTSTIHSNDTYFGYINGSIDEKISLRLIGSINKLSIDNEYESDYIFLKGDKLRIKSLGKLISNPKQNKNKSQIFSNSLIYNTSSRYELSQFNVNGSVAFTLSQIDDSSLKIGDRVEFLERNTEISISSLNDVGIISIDKENGEIIFNSNLSALNSLKQYDIRRILRVSSSTLIPISNDKVTCDITNVYSEKNGNYYIASNSLPSYQITNNIFKYDALSVINFDNQEQQYTSVEFNSEVSFLSGDRVYYSYSDTTIPGLSEGSYYIVVSSNNKEIKLYISRSFISIDKFVYLGDIPSGVHTFTLLSQKTENEKIHPQKLLKRINLNSDELYSEKDPIGSQTIGILANGVEILSYNSIDKIYYGPIASVFILNSGSDYDVINPPRLEFSYGNAKLEPVIQGSIKEVHIDPQEFNIEMPISLSVSGGNGKNVILSPITKLKSREVFFDARILEESGGLSITSETITFLTNHNFFNGQKIIYDINNINNQKIGIGSYQGSDNDSGRYIGNNSIFYAKVINSKTIQIHSSFGDYTSGINTVGFTTVGNFGIHKFKTEGKRILDSIKVVSGGEGFTNRNLVVKPIGISTYNHTINFNNHGFSTGELVTYDRQTTPVIGLSTSNQYYVLKVNENSFRICNAGIGGTDNQNYLRRNYIKFGSTGTGYQYFNYPKITVDVSYTLPTGQEIKSIVATPVVRGSIIQTYLYESGTNYGSDILNLEKSPDVKILIGELGQVKPTIFGGKIVGVFVMYSGLNYYSVPDLIVESNTGVGAKLRAKISNGRLDSVIILDGGYGYNSDNTTIRIVAAGKTAAFLPKVRELTLDNSYKYGTQYQNFRDPSYEILYKSKNGSLQYTISGYSDLLKNLFNEISTIHSPIIGWSYDGIPIYGPFGYSDPENFGSAIKLLQSGYSLITVNNRISTVQYPLGYFIDDYEFTNSGDLDEYNGRFCKTPEFPNGVYAYFATAKLNPNGNYIGVFPYFIGKYYRSKLIIENTNSSLNQNFNFFNSKLFRNTLPYKFGDKYARNDFIDISTDQIFEVDNTISGEIEKINIIDGGSNYKVDDLLYFDNLGTGGYGLNGSVNSINGKEIENILANVKLYENSKLYKISRDKFYVKYNPNYDIPNNSFVTISGLTSSFSNLNKKHIVNVSEFNTKLISSITFGNPGIVTDIQVENLPNGLFPNRVSIGSSIKISGESYDQHFNILNYFEDLNVLRVERTSSSGLSTANSPVSFLPEILLIQGSILDSIEPENYIKYFNPTQSIGVGTFSGTFTGKTFYNGPNLINISIPSQSIYLPNHGFTTNQKVILRRPTATSPIQVVEEPGGVSFQLLGGGTLQEELVIINKSKDYIGIVTSVESTSTSNGLYFDSSSVVGSNSFKYSFETTFSEILCDVTNVTTTVSISTSHNLLKNDRVFIQINPNKSVGIGNSTSINLKYNNDIKSIITKSIQFIPGDVNLQNNKINITNHLLNSGDKVYYISTSVISGLSTGTYYTHKIDSNNINLSESYEDSLSVPPKFIKFNSVGIGTQELNLIQSKINVIRNNDLVFDVSDSSLQGYEFRLYIDKNLSKEFISIASTGAFSLIGVGTVGVSTDASIVLKYSNFLPKNLYYTLEKGNELVQLQDTILNSSEISFIDSLYTNSYEIFNVTNTNFDINLEEIPEEFSYELQDCDILKYITNSKNANGSVHSIKIIDNGKDYNDIPNYINSNSSSGKGLYVVPTSTNIGKLLDISIKNIGFEYPTDPTLLPELNSTKNARITRSNTLLKVDVFNGGKNYPSAPNLVVVDSTTGERINNGLIRAKMSGGGTGNSNIERVLIDVPVNGLPSTPVTIRSINNSNGILIDRIESSQSGILTCLIKTPILGFPTDPFTIGDEVFVENIVNVQNTGRGFNSENHGYEFFKVIDYTPGLNPGKIEIQIPTLYGNPGVAITFQINTFATIVKKTNYPVFNSIQDYSLFLVGESISIISEENVLITDLIVETSNKNYLKLFGNYELKVGDVISGSTSGYLATIENLSSSNGNFEIDSEYIKTLDWSNEIGKLSNDTQFISDNNYYQNLSYTIQSEKTWDQISPIVNSMVHPIGTKNFTDTQISSSTSGIVSTGLVPSSILDSIQSFISKSKVDVIKNLDFVKDFDVNLNTSRILKFKNLKLTDYFESRTNRVLQINDISGEFSSIDDNEQRNDQIILVLPKNQLYGRFLIQIKSSPIDLIEDQTNEIQFTEIIALKNNDDAYFIEKSTITNIYGISEDSNVFGTRVGEIVPIVDDVKNYYFLFIPTDPYNTDYEIKILSTSFLTTLNSNSSLKVGSSDIYNDVSVISPNQSKDLLSLDSSKYKVFNSQLHIINRKTLETNYVEIYAAYDGQDIYFSDYYFDGDDKNNFSYGFIGSFGLSLSGGLIKLNYFNENTTENITISSKTISFDDTASGIGTYRFKSLRQEDGSERTLLLESGKVLVSLASTIFSYDTNLFSSVKSLVRVSVGSTISVHQLMTIHDNNNSVITEYPSLLVNNNLGIGTFSSFVDENEFKVIFTPYANFNNSNIVINYYNEVFYTFLDEINSPLPLTVSPLYESINIAKYFSINSKDKNRLNFNLRYDNIPIFSKSFDPFNENILDPISGIFTIDNHFFSTGENLIYEPRSTFIGLGQSSMGIPNGSITDVGISTNRLPSSVYAIKLSNSQFKISLTQENANSGTGITFTYLGEGNAHRFEMFKKNEKSLVTINNLVQYPLSYTGIAHSLFDNGGQIGIGNTFFTLSGISSIKPTDLLKVNTEYMKVLNVGIGTSNFGPILFFTGDKNIVEVERGFAGTSAISHFDDSEVDVYRGSYNISGDEIFFTQAPRGNIFDLVSKDERNLERSRAQFSGRVFLRQDYSTNVIFDDISSEFTGIGQTFILKSQGINTVGLGTTSGNGILFINGIYQTPLTQNATNFNFEIVENESVGVSSVVFTGIRNENDEITISESDINQNQLPRGGIIVSLGSTSGLGYAPLVGAKVRPDIDINGAITNIVGIATTGNSIAFSTVSYNNETGILNVLTSSTLGLIGANQVKLVGLAFTCSTNPGIVSYFPSHDESLDIVGVGTTSFSVQVGTSTLSHYYVGYGTIYPWYEDLNFGSGYIGSVSIGVTEVGHVGSSATITATVGLGGTLSFNIIGMGTGYLNPTILIPTPSYQNLPVIGVSRLGIGETTDTGIGLLMNVEIAASSNNVGIGTTLFEVSSFRIVRSGYNFKRGDVFKPVGLVTAKGLVEPIEEFELVVLETYIDNFAAWQFGEFNLLDSILKFQSGSRLSYPLYYENQLLSFQKNVDDPDSQVIDFDSLLVIFINGILQEPKIAYEFNGGSSVRFLTPPKPNDNVEIYFYIGTRDVDSVQVDVDELLQVGDTVQVYSNNSNLKNTVTQNPRTIFDFISSDLAETNLYFEEGVDDQNEKPLYWEKQKEDIIINGTIFSKSRDSLEPQIYPTARIIKDFSSSDNQIYVDNSRLFNYEDQLPTEKFDLLIVPSNESIEVGIVTAIVSSAGTIQSLSITNSGVGYTGNESIKISNPYYGVGIGIGTTATAQLVISNGSILNVSIINSGFGYTNTNPPQVIVEQPNVEFEEVSDANVVTGFDGIITGISTVVGIGTDLALRFTLFTSGADYDDLSIGDPIYIFDTQVGTGLTTVDNNENQIVGISTTNLDNIYYVHGLNTLTGIITCNISKNTNIIGIGTTGTLSNPVGKFSWGKISGFSRSSNPISIGVSGLNVSSGLSTYPTVQRKGYGLRKTGALKKDLTT